MGRFRKAIEKIQAPTEPGLSTAQLMLVNDDLKPGKKIQINKPPPLAHFHVHIQYNKIFTRNSHANLIFRIVDPERRQWRWLNFVAFWIADSLNVVRIFPLRFE